MWEKVAEWWDQRPWWVRGVWESGYQWARAGCTGGGDWCGVCMKLPLGRVTVIGNEKAFDRNLECVAKVGWRAR